MATKVNVLLLGGCHSYGHGIGDKESFIEQVIRRYARAGQSVSLTGYAPLTIREASRLLPRLRLSQYDLIVVQLGNYELQRPPAFGQLLSVRPPSLSPMPAIRPFSSVAAFRHQQVWSPVLGRRGWVNGLKDVLKKGLLRSLAAVKALPRLQQVRQEMQILLTLLSPYRYKTIIMTPFPHRDPISNWLRQQGGQWLLAQSGTLHVFDTQQVVQPRDEFFLPNDIAHLNAVSHELIGSELYDYWRSESIIITSASIDRERR